MRWKFPDPHDREEGAGREAIVRRIERWWGEFARKAADLDLHFRKGKALDVPGFMRQNLQSIDGNLMWEFGQGPDGKGHRLAITPEANFHLRPLVDELMEKAPRLPEWTFMNFRPRVEAAEAEVNVHARTKGTLKDARVSCKIGEGRRIDVMFHFPPGPSLDSGQCDPWAFVGAESLLGEELLDQWVGGIGSAPLPKRGLLASMFGKTPGSLATLAATSELPSLFDEVKATVMDRALVPAWRKSEKGVVLKLDPGSPPYPG